jgi:hypothetical protein
MSYFISVDISFRGSEAARLSPLLFDSNFSWRRSQPRPHQSASLPPFLDMRTVSHDLCIMRLHPLLKPALLLSLIGGKRFDSFHKTFNYNAKVVYSRKSKTTPQAKLQKHLRSVPSSKLKLSTRNRKNWYCCRRQL